MHGKMTIFASVFGSNEEAGDHIKITFKIEQCGLVQ